MKGQLVLKSPKKDMLGRTAYENIYYNVENWLGLTEIREYIVERPRKCFLLTVLLASLLFPLSFYLTFSISTFCITFTIFLIVEGSLIFASTLAVLTVLSFIVPLSMLFAVFLLTWKKF